jgi:glyoxylase-like metal-dependent hydrolase (beta-lactamase superfamily II)/8-oxo-dGTP pyrophosphatase MutT (NUDIX family)
MTPSPAEEAFDVFAGARKAASLIVLRDLPGYGLEVLMLRRAERDGDIRSGVAVFPGGVLDARDREAHGRCTGWSDPGASQRLGLPAGGLDYFLAAARECFEEAGLLFASGLDAPTLQRAQAEWRVAMHRGEQPLHAMCEALQLTVDLNGWHYWSHWLTPPGQPQRFDTRFFVARAPQGQHAEADGGEAVELMWLTPQRALQPEQGLKLLPVTRRTLQQLARFPRVQQALAFAAAQGPVPLTMPRKATGSQGPRIVLPDELPWAEVGRLDPRGRGDAHAEIVAGRAVRLSPRVVRVTAPNPGVMTGPGTNSYLVGDPQVNRWTVIDPGPEDGRHLQALLAAAPGPIERILVTHTHVDHSPGARALAAATGAPVVGRRAAHASGQDPGFEPSREPVDGERLVLGPQAVLEVIATPGHASNHLCYLLEQEKLLFTGDHVMQGSTVVINPPDGDMAAYLGALQSLLARDLEWLAPGHGFLVARPADVLRALIAHRLRREAKVLDALREHGPAPVERLVAAVYDDTPVQLHPVARRSLLAHLLKLQAEQRAGQHDGDWRLAG